MLYYVLLHSCMKMSKKAALANLSFISNAEGPIFILYTQLEKELANNLILFIPVKIEVRRSMHGSIDGCCMHVLVRTDDSV